MEKKQTTVKPSIYWISLLLLNALLFAAGDACNKFVVGIPMWEKVFIRSAIGLVFVCLTFLKNRPPFKPGHWPLQLCRAVVSFLVTFTTFYAAVNMKLGDFTTLKNLGPVFAIIFSVLLLKDKFNVWSAVSIGISFIGMVILTPPRFDSSIIPSLVAVAAAVCIGLMTVFGRALRKYSNPNSVMLISMLFNTLLSGVLMLTSGQPLVVPPASMILALLGIALLPTFSQQLSVYIGFNVSPVQSMVFNYAGPIWAVVLGFVFFGEYPTLQFAIGAIFIIGGGILSGIKNTPKVDNAPAAAPAGTEEKSEK